jgi:hypothetical protein
MTRRVCVVTVHGIGFQQPPEDGRPGYADGLHALLGEKLGDLLCQDPDPAGRGSGPVYVQSTWRGSQAAGRDRLVGPLGEGQVAHVALVYSDLEDIVPRPGATVETAIKATLALAHYASVTGAVRLLLDDAWANLRASQSAHTATGLVPRSGVPRPHHLLGRLIHEQSQGEAPPSGPAGTLIALEDDVASYVARNDLRERVRGFVQEALVRLAARDDIDLLVVNAHSQGTVICFDVLARLPVEASRGRISHFITAGSPVRKYVDLFSWGNRVGALATLAAAGGWLNFWDARDPVADPLDPPASWRPGTPSTTASPDDPGLLISLGRDGAQAHCPVTDVQVDNLARPMDAGLPAHDYWDNEEGFIGPASDLLRRLAEQ